MPNNEHVCKQIDYCICNTQALEPTEGCPIHYGPPFPPRCVDCGRLMPWPVAYQSERP
jgi:hypothetical protein